MNEDQAFVPQMLREVNFYGDDLAIAIVSNEAFVALRPIVEYLGLAWGSQRNRLLRNEQATDISNQVKALAELLTRKEPGKNHYQSIFGEIYRRFRVSSYKLIRQEQYQGVLAFLDDWLKSAG